MSCPVCGATGRPVLADLFSGAGGAGHGYQLAGFHIVGIDVKPQPNYPGCFIQADAMEADLSWADAIHASPPCVDHMKFRAAWAYEAGTGWLLDAIRQRLLSQPAPWVIENVPGSPLRVDFRLCGCMFGLQTDEWLLVRERWFETSWGAFELRAPCVHTKKACTVLKHGAFYISPRPHHVKRYIPKATSEALMRISWMTKQELGEAIPPPYTEHIGAALMAQLMATEEAAS